MTPMRCAQHEGRKDIVEFITEWISKKPKRDRKPREQLLNNKLKEKVVKRKFKEDTDEDFKPEKGKDVKKKDNNKNRSVSKTKNNKEKSNDKGKIKNRRKKGDDDDE